MLASKLQEMERKEQALNAKFKEHESEITLIEKALEEEHDLDIKWDTNGSMIEEMCKDLDNDVEEINVLDVNGKILNKRSCSAKCMERHQ